MSSTSGPCATAFNSARVGKRATSAALPVLFVSRELCDDATVCCVAVAEAEAAVAAARSEGADSAKAETHVDLDPWALGLGADPDTVAALPLHLLSSFLAESSGAGNGVGFGSCLRVAVKTRHVASTHAERARLAALAAEGGLAGATEGGLAGATEAAQSFTSVSVCLNAARLVAVVEVDNATLELMARESRRAVGAWSPPRQGSRGGERRSPFDSAAAMAQARRVGLPVVPVDPELCDGAGATREAADDPDFCPWALSPSPNRHALAALPLQLLSALLEEGAGGEGLRLASTTRVATEPARHAAGGGASTAATRVVLCVNGARLAFTNVVSDPALVGMVQEGLRALAKACPPPPARGPAPAETAEASDGVRRF